MDIDTVVVPQQVLSVAPPVVVKTSAERVRIRKPRGHIDDTLRIKSSNCLIIWLRRIRWPKKLPHWLVLTLGRRNTTSKNTTMTKYNACTLPIVEPLDLLCFELKERISKPVTAVTLSASSGTFVSVLKFILKELKIPHEAARNSKQSDTQEVPVYLPFSPIHPLDGALSV
jgi:hypothetical protein